MGNTFEEQKQQFIQNYNQARPIMAILGDEVRQEILLVLIEAGGNGGIRVVIFKSEVIYQDLQYRTTKKD